MTAAWAAPPLELPDTAGCGRYRVRAPMAEGDAGRRSSMRLKKGASKSTASNMARSMRRWNANQGANVWLVFAIREGKNRE